MYLDLFAGSLPVKKLSLDSDLWNRVAKRVAIFLLLVLAMMLHVQFAIAQQVNVNMNPSNGKVVAGTAVITQSGLQTQVNQSSQRAVVNWDSFNVGKDAQVTFNQPNSSAVTLNRVTGSSPSVIDGAIKANGQVVLVNPNGITFGKGAQVDAAGVVATTMNISNKDFMEGKSTYKGDGTGKIINEGTISTNAKDGYIALLAPEVRNDGYLVAKMGQGTVALGAGKQITLDFRGDSLISLKVDESTVNALIENKRLVKVEGGLVIIAAGAANNLMGSVIKNTGRISASSLQSNGGVIELVAGTITQAGQISANGKGANSNGGKITLQGEDITLADGSNTNARGAANGGTINVGTTKVTYTQNQDGTRTNVQAENLAKTTTVQAGAVVDASSTNKGNGGEINIWSSVKTIVAGTFKAQGGSLGGNGGYVETSSSGILEILKSTVVDVTAKLGKAGHWLLDPEEMTISASTASAISSALATSNVTIEVKGDLTVASGAAIAPVNGAATTLTLNATGTITNNGTISTSASGSLVTNSAALSLAEGSTTSANQITATAQAVTVNGTLSSTGGSTGSINVTGGAIVVAGRVSSNGSSTTNSTTTTNTATTRTREEELAAQAPTTPAAAGTNNTTTATNTTNTVAQVAAKAQAAAASTAVAATVASNNVSANAAKVSTPAVTTINANTGAATITPPVNVVNLTAPTAAVLNTNIAQAASAAQSGTTTVINIASQANNSTPTAPSSPLASLTFTAQTPSQVAQTQAAQSATPNTAGGTITLTASNSVTATSTATITANASPTTVDQPAISSAGGNINITAPQVTTQSNSLLQANGNNGPGGNFNLQATQLAIAGSVQANGNTGGTITAVAGSSHLSAGASLQANGNNGPGGAITLQTTQNQIINNAQLQANGSGNGGNIQLTTTQGDINLQSALIQTNGANGRGGQIAIAATHYTEFNSSTIEATGFDQGGTIKVGNDAPNNSNNNLGGTLPFSIFTNLDANSILSANQTNSLNTSSGGFIETSGQTINLLASINAGRGGMWLLDPYDIIIDATNAGYINTALNASTNVVITTANATNSVGSNSISSTSGTGNIYIKSAINATTGSATLTMTATEIQLEANVTTRGNQTYNGNLLLAQNSTLTSNNGNVTVNGDIRSTSSLLTGYLSLTGAGAYNFMGTTGTVGATASTIGGGSLSYSSVTSSYTWIPGSSFTSQYLLVGAGGAGGSDNGGGGGAGAVTSDLAYAVTGGATYTIKVGVGAAGTAGGLSSITVGGATITATGGSKGSNGGNWGGGAGGSSGYTTIDGVSSSPYTGGPYRAGSCCTQQSGGGGGGSAGSTSNTTGGVGSASSITGTSITYGVGGQGAVSSGSNSSTGATATGAGSGGGGGSGFMGAGSAGRNGVAIFQGSGFSPDVYSITINSGSGALVVTGGVSNVSGITVNSSNSANRIDGAISGIASVTKQGAGLLLLNGTNTHSGGTTISAGTLKAGSNQAFGVLASTLTVTSGATLDLNGTNQTILNPLTASGVGVSSNGAIINSNTGTGATYRGSITLGAMTQIGGPGNLTLTGAISSSTGIAFVNSSYVTATNSSNNVNAISGSAVRGLDFVNSAALSVGTVNSISGFTSATGPISITANSGGLAVSQIISTTGNLTLSGTASSTTTALGITVAITGNAVSLTGTAATGYAVNVSGAITASSGITVSGTATTAANIVSLSAMTLSAAGSGDISITANNTSAGGNAGITQTGAITNNVSGSNITFTSNNKINQTGAISMVANESGIASLVAYDTTSGNRLADVTAGALSTVSTNATAAVNYSITTNGSAIVVPAISATGSILLDNRCSACATPITDSSANATNATALTAVTINGSLTAGTSVSVHGVDYGTVNGVYITGGYNITAGTSITLDGSTMVASSSTVRGLYQPTAGTYTAGTTIDLTGVSNQNYGGILVNSVMTAGGNITMFGNTINPLQAGSNDGVSLTNASGTISSTNGNISITGWTVGQSSTGANIGTALQANNGTITIVGMSSNTYGVNLTKDASAKQISITGTLTAAGTTATNITGALNIVSSASSMYAGGGVTAISVIGNAFTTSSGGITSSGAVNVNSIGGDVLFKSNAIISQTGTIALVANTSANQQYLTYDTTTGDKSSTITSGALTIALGSTSNINYVMKSKGSALNPGAIGSTSVYLPGSVTIDNTYGGTGGVGGTPATGYITAANLSTYATTSVGLTVDNAIYADSGIALNGAAYQNNGVAISAVMIASTNPITITGITTNSSAVYSSAAITAVSDELTITGTSTTGQAVNLAAAVTGQAVTITANGTTATTVSTIDIVTINDIYRGGTTQLGAIGIGSTGGTYIGDSASLPTLSTAYLTAATPAAANVIYAMAGATSRTAYYLIGVSGTTKIIQVAVTNLNGETFATVVGAKTNSTSIALTGSQANALGGTTNILDLWNGSSAGGTGTVTVQTPTYTYNGTYGASNLTFTGQTLTHGQSGDFAVTANDTAAGGNTGITQSGAITQNVNGGNITFTSNNKINQTGAISMVANTSGSASAITYDTTSGNRLSNITAAAITTTSGSTYDVNYSVLSAGSAITVAAIAVPGSVTIDNTYGSASGAKSSGYFNGTNNTTSNVTVSAGVLVGGVITAGASITIKGVTSYDWGLNNSYTLTASNGDITLVGVGPNGIYQMASLIATSGNILASAYATSSVWSYHAQNGSQKNYIALGNIDIVGYSTTYSSALNIQNVLMQTTSGDITLSAKGGSTGNGAVHQAVYLAAVVINAGGDLVIQGATNTSGIATAAPSTAATNTLGNSIAVHFASTTSWAYGGTSYTGFKAVSDISVLGTSSGSYGIYITAPIQSTAGSISMTGTSTTGYGIASSSTGTVTAFTGVALYGRGSAGSVTTGALVRNSGTTGGVIINAVFDANIGAVTNSGADGIRITGGNGVAAGTTTGGTITALGTVTNTAGVVALSMASPRTANSYDIEGKIGITALNASTDNIRYSVQGGTFTTPITYTSGNYIDYRAGTTVYTITVSLGANYSAAYGTAYTDSSALTWLRNNATVTLSATPFGVSAASIKAGLVWNSTIGSAGINANSVQSATTIVAANILAGTGQGVTLSGTSRTYTITPKALTITNLASTSTYDGSTTYASLVGTAGYSVSGLVTSIGGVAVTDAVSSVTQTIKSGSVVGSGSTLSGVAQYGSFNAVPSAAVGTGLSNYTITYVGVASTVNKATITITAANDTKVYGNTTTGAGITYSAGAASASGGVGYSITSGSLYGSDSLTGVTLTSTGGAATTAVGTGISIVPSAASGSGLSNYTITYANGAMAVTQRPLTITATNRSTDYGTSYALGTSAFTTSGLVNSDSVNSATLKYSGSSTVAGTTNAGTYSGGIIASAASGTGLSNYSISYVAGNLTVATKALTITANTQTSEYGTAYSLGTSAFTTSGLVNSDSVSSVTLLYSNSATVAPTVNAATYSGGITPSAAIGSGLSNYSISYVAGNLVVGKATITITPNGSVATYDGTTLSNSTYSQSTANYTATGYKNSDVAADVAITLTGSMAFNGSTSTTVKNAASYALAVGTLAGTTTNGNYQIAFANPSSAVYLINPATVSVSASKDYDGTRSFTSSQITVATGIGSQTLALSGNALANSANVTGVSTLSTSGLTLGDGTNGGLASNYQLPATTTNVTINPLSLTAAIIGTPTKQYDATDRATLSSSNYSLSGFLAGEGATVSQTVGSFNSANATSNTSYTPATTVSATLVPANFTANAGTTLSNYILPTSASGSGVITTAPLTLTANSYAAFSGQSPGTFAGSVTGAQGSDSISVSIAQTPSGTTGIYTLTPSAVMSAALVGNYGTPTVVTGTYVEAQQYQLVVTAANASNSYGTLRSSSTANSGVNLVAQYCTVSSNCTSGTIITLNLTAPTATLSQITTSSSTTPTWVATDSSSNSYNIKVVSDSSLAFSTGTYLNAGTYTFTPTGQTNATISGATNPVIYVPGVLSVSPVTLSVTNNSAPNKVYDATTTLTNGVSLSASNQLSGDSLTLTGAGTYSSKNVGTTNYTISNVSLSGADAANYRYTSGNINGTNGTITAAPITISGLAASNKRYDAGLSATITGTPTAVGILGSDTVSVSGAVTTGSFADSNVATAIAVTPVLSGLTLSNSNYEIVGVTSALTANINAAPITVTINKVYDGSTAVANANISITGVAGQTLVLSSGTATLTSPNVNNAAFSTLNGAVLADGTGLASNYTLTSPSAVVNVTAAPISISATNAVKVYDTSTSILTATTAPSASVVSGTLYTNSVTGYTDALSGGSFSYATSDAGSGNKTLNVSGVDILNNATNAASNYTITYVANTTSTITPAPVTISGLSASNKQYDTGLSATVSGTPTVVGALGSDTVNVSGSVTAGSFASANVGSAIVVTPVLSGLTLSNTNYQISGVTSSITANITAAPITISGLTAANKQYDTGLSATVSGTPVAAGVLGSDVVTVSGSVSSGSFASANVGTGIAVTPVLSGLSLSNSNYEITGVTTTLSANITAAPVTVTASNQSTTYGTPLDLGTSGFTATGLLGSDSISAVTLTQLGNSTVPGTQNAGVYTGSTNGILASAATGTNLSNYQITYVPGTLTIAKKGINVIANDASMTYADASLPTLSYQTVSGLVNGDQMSGSLATTATPYSGVAGSASNVGSYFITQGTVTAGNNYEITYTRASLTVNPASLYVTAENQTSTYGSLLVLPQSGSNAYSVVGLRNGDYVSSSTVLYSGNQTVPGTTNAGSYAGALDISAATGVGMSNYSINYVAGDLTIAKAALLVTAVDSAKFVGMSDLAGYGGVMYSGFKNSDSAVSGALGSAVVSVSRSNSSVNDAGSYSGVLVPNVDRALDNYTVSYGNGNFTIVGANQLLVTVGSNTTVYGTAPTYTAGGMTVSYCTDCAAGNSSPNIVTVSGANISISGSTVAVTAGSTTGTFSLTPTAPVMNSSNTQLAVGAYTLGASGTSITTSGGSPNFNAVTAIGGLTVTPLTLTYADLGVAGISQVYTGSVNMSNLQITPTSGFLPGDSVNASATGTFASKNVGTGVSYTIGVSLSGADAANYQMSAGASYTGNNGTITQLSSVTYTGSSAGGNWSNPANWTTTGTSTVGAIPDLSNVATVIIPVGSTVIYDAGVDGPVTSSVVTNGNVTINLPTSATISMPISGAGTVTIANSGVITLSGDNSYTGGTILSAGSSLVAGSNNAIAGGAITSNGTSLNPASFGMDSGVTLPGLSISGGTTKLTSNITTSGAQTYAGPIVIDPSSGSTTTLSSTNSAITFTGTLDAVTDKAKSLVINAGSGVVTIANSVGSLARLNDLTVTGSRINLLADILTAATQTYTGAVYIGDISYIGLTPVVGFLYSSTYTPYFEYQSGGTVSTIDYLNLNPIYIRTLISLDPSVTFNGAVNDITANTHTLLIAAVAPTSVNSSVSAINSAASITFASTVGDSAPLYSLNTQTIVNSGQSDYLTAYIGTTTLVGGVSTYGSQTYRANLLSASAASQPGTFTFSIYDPNASINYLLPMQTAANSGCSGATCGQMNLQNPNHLDALVVNGDNNYLNNQNTLNVGGVGYWNARMTQNAALGATPITPPATPVLTPTEYIAEFIQRSDGLALNSNVPMAPMIAPPQGFMRQSLLNLSPVDLRQVNPTVSQLAMMTTSNQNATVSVTSPDIEGGSASSSISSKSGLSIQGTSSMECKLDERGELQCGEAD